VGYLLDEAGDVLHGRAQAYDLVGVMVQERAAAEAVELGIPLDEF
jgi:hypothetical protein